MKHNKIILLFIIPALITSCSSSKITTTWKLPGADQRVYNKIMVIAVMKESDLELRKDMEKHLTGDLKDLGYNTFSSLTQYNADEFAKLDTLAAYNKLRGDNVDAVLTVVLLNKKKEREYIQRKEQPLPKATPADQVWNYYKNVVTKIDNGNYYQDVTSYFWESNFYDLRSKQRLYSAKTESFEPASKNSLAHQYGLIIIENMVKNKVLKNMLPEEE